MNITLRTILILLCLGAMASSAVAAPLGSSVRPAIPAEVQQIICVDYRALKNSDVAQALKAQVLPDNLKEFETALKSLRKPRGRQAKFLKAHADAKG